MSMPESLIDVIRHLAQLLKSVFTGDKVPPLKVVRIQRKLFINSPIADPRPCTRSQAIRFYSTLRGFQQQMEALSSIKDDEQLGVWFAEFNAWTDANWKQVYADPCDATSFFTTALRATSWWAVLSTVTSIRGEIPADAIMRIVLELAEYDTYAMELVSTPKIILQLNRIVRDLPPCSPEQAIAFYATIDKLEEQSRALLHVDSNKSLVAWVFAFQEWREDTWGRFYDEPCGLILENICHLESRIYAAACMQYNEDSSGAASVITKAIDEWRSIATSDMATING